MLSKSLETGSIGSSVLDMKNKTCMISMADSLHNRKRNWSLPESLTNAQYKRKFDRQETGISPPSKKGRTSEVNRSTRPVRNSDRRRSNVKNAVDKGETLTRAFRRDTSRNYENNEYSCENNDNLDLDKNVQCCTSCDEKRHYENSTFAQNNFDANLKETFLKMYPNLLNLRVRLVDFRKETTDSMSHLSITRSGYWLRPEKLCIPSTRRLTRLSLRLQEDGKPNPKRIHSQYTLHANSDSSAKNVNMGKMAAKSIYSETYFQIRDSRVVLSPLSNRELKLLKGGKLRSGMLKTFLQNQKGTNMHCSENKYKRRSSPVLSQTQGRSLGVSTARAKVKSSKQNGRVRVTSKSSNCRKVVPEYRVAQGMTTPARKQRLSVFSTSQRKNNHSWKKNSKSSRRSDGLSDLFEDPLYACLLSSSESECFVNLDDAHTGYSEKQSTPLSKYLDVRDESTDRVSAKSTPTRFHTKAELKQHVSKVRRMRAQKLKRNRQKAKKEPEKCFSNVDDDDSVEELSAFEQLKRALGLMDKVQKKMCDDGYSEEERYFGDSDE